MPRKIEQRASRNRHRRAPPILSIGHQPAGRLSVDRALGSQVLQVQQDRRCRTAP
jgi:hypothetical protein